MTETRRCVLLKLVRQKQRWVLLSQNEDRDRVGLLYVRNARRWAHAVPGSEKTRWKIACIVFRLTAGQPGGLMRTPDSLMSNILIIVAGLAWPWLVSCDWKPGLDFKNGSCGLTGCLRVFCCVIPDCLVDVGGCTVSFSLRMSLCHSAWMFCADLHRFAHTGDFIQSSYWHQDDTSVCMAESTLGP